MKNKISRNFLPPFLSACAAAAAVLAVFFNMGLYPFGTRTAAWCDMNQQVVPLLCQFKDILDGKSGMFLSFKNAGGMNFWGVFFFFLASPFSLTVKFVEKTDMLLFVNILIILKIMTCAFTASFYFCVSGEHKRLSSAACGLLGFIYALSGYCMLFYQNVIWLDMAYLFPLLLLSLKRLKKGSALPFAAILTAMMVVNYYIGYMTAVFLLLSIGAYAYIFRKKQYACEVCGRFISGCAIAALCSAVVWLPSFIQYLSSGRITKLFDSLTEGDLVTDYETVFPVMMCSGALIVFVFFAFLKARQTREFRLRMFLFLMLCLPLVIEPINKMWHTGSYMSFPARYAFMTIFFALIIAAYFLQKKVRFGFEIKKYIAAFLLCASLLPLFRLSTARFINENAETLTAYTKTLNGDEASFKGLCRLLITAMLCAAAICIVYRKGYINKSVFIVFICALTFVESLGNVRIYMTSAGERSETTNALQREVMGLENKIDDSSFYRVKTESKLFDYNMIGAFGYDSIAHYTSLTNEDYMFAMKRLGYTSVWMEVGSCGGTELTDALLAVGYEISRTDKNSVGQVDGYYIDPLKIKLGLGVISKGDVNSPIPAYLTRAQVQQYIFNLLFGEGEFVEYFEPDEGEYSAELDTAPRFFVKQNERLIYRADVSGEKTLYFDCFDKLTNELSEPIYNSFSVRVNGRSVSVGYPYSKENGVLKLGSFKDERVIIEVEALKDVECASFGVFGLDTELLQKKCAEAQTVDLKEVKNGLSGNYSGSGGTVFLSVPYDSGFTLKINGEKYKLKRSAAGFMSFELPAGESEIEISFIPRGLKTGAVLSVSGIILAIVYAFLRKRGVRIKANKLCYHAALAGGAFIITAVYVLPLVLNILFFKE